jgi:hypothetical protein
MPSRYLNHPLPVSVLSLCSGEEPKMFHSFWHCFLHLKRIYTSGVLTSEKKKEHIFWMSYSECFDPFKQKHTTLWPMGKRTRLGIEHVQMDFQSDKQRGKIGPPTIACLGNIKNSPSK